MYMYFNCIDSCLHHRRQMALVLHTHRLLHHHHMVKKDMVNLHQRMVSLHHMEIIINLSRRSLYKNHAEKVTTSLKVSVIKYTNDLLKGPCALF